MRTEATIYAVASASTGLFVGLNDVTVPIVGVPLVTVGMAAAGSLLSFAYGVRVSRRQMFQMALVNTFIGAAATALLPAVLGWTWVDNRLQPPLAFVLSLSARWLVPLAIDIAPAAIRGALSKFFGITVPSGEKQ